MIRRPAGPALARIAGVDEAGRGPLAGPVVAAAVILPADFAVAGIDDSKKLSAGRRAALAGEIEAGALAWSVASADVHEIDRLNILHATMLAMRRAILALSPPPTHVRVDGNRCPSLDGSGVDLTLESIVGGDACDIAIGAASILAKVRRDGLMQELDRHYPGYGFARHKGYPTKAHVAALTRIGPCPEHRRSFAPVRKVLARGVS